MKILVTGGAGFIGKYLVKTLLKNHEVTIFDNFTNSTKESISYLEDLGVKIIEGDINNNQEIHHAAKDQQLVIHLAAKISVIDSIKNPHLTFETNVNGTKNVLESCKINNIKKLIVASSAAVYGEGSELLKVSEEYDTNPISPYGRSKLQMENIIKEFSINNELNCIILRFFNIFGIGQTDEYAGVITKFIKCINDNTPLEIYGDGNQVRDFVAIEDIVELILKIINYEQNNKIEIFNVGNETSKIIDLANLVINIGKIKIEKIFKETKEGDIRFSSSSYDKAQKILEYNPKISLENGIKKIFYDKNYI